MVAVGWWHPPRRCVATVFGMPLTRLDMVGDVEALGLAGAGALAS
jgi:hypothetical protein